MKMMIMQQWRNDYSGIIPHELCKKKEDDDNRKKTKWQCPYESSWGNCPLLDKWPQTFTLQWTGCGSSNSKALITNNVGTRRREESRTHTVIWRPWRSQVYKDKEGYPMQTVEDEDDEEEEQKVQQWCVSSIAVSVVKSWKRVQDGAVMMCHFHCSTHGEVLKRKRRRCSNDVPWVSMEKRMMKEMTSLCTIHAQHVTTMPKDIQLAHNTHGREMIAHDQPQMNYWSWLWMTVPQQMKPS